MHAHLGCGCRVRSIWEQQWACEVTHIWTCARHTPEQAVEQAAAYTALADFWVGDDA